MGGQLLELIDDGGQSVHGRLGSQKLPMGTRWMAAERRARRDVAEDRAFGRDSGAVAYDQMVGDSHVPGQDHIIPDPGASCDADAGHDEASLTDVHIVSHVDQIIDLGTAPDDGVVDAPSVDTRMGPHLHFIADQAATHVRYPAVPRSV
jgi:hypothetical protein